MWQRNRKLENTLEPYDKNDKTCLQWMHMPEITSF